MEATETIQRRYQRAVESLVEKVQRDTQIVAAILLGSLSYDVVWEKSDIDLLLVTEESRRKAGSYVLVEDSINIHASLSTRSQFKRSMEGAIEGSFTHSTLIRGTLLFSRDDSISELFERRHHLGARDREIRLMSAGASVIWALAKAQKWLHVKNDVEYSFFWIMKVLDSFATIEVLQQGEIPGREVILQALRLNSEFFRSVYTDLIHGEKNRDTILTCLEKLEGYIRERSHVLFRPVLTYLSEAGGVRSSTELNHHLSNNMGFTFGDTICEWLADEEVIQKLSTPVRLTEKSRVDVEEAAYYYEEEIEG